ncbi:beta-lactamase [Roseivivax isoporae LMG 25204]|uniref:Beta-lactamase n=2 Tax=Roseivivax TaxID=93682 RepID=X7FDK5_9RHOB|nr:beta-lactamase [Roseivivax isoporae LMG 25204]
MLFHLSVLPRVAAGLALCMLAITPARADDAADRLALTVRQIEDRLDARVGVVVRDSATGWSWGHRADERFLMNSTFKAPLCGALLARVDAGETTLDTALPVTAADMVDHAPVTETRIGATMTLDALCRAAVDMSDNPAANIVLDHVGGPEGFTSFLRGIGDGTTRLDRTEPGLNTYAAGDPRDTTTPAAMVATLERLLLGDALSAAARARLTGWMTPGSVTGALLRAHTPEGWHVADKSGAGRVTRNIVGMVTPPGAAPHLVAIYLSEAEVDFATRNAALSELSAAVVAVIAAR